MPWVRRHWRCYKAAAGTMTWDDGIRDVAWVTIVWSRLLRGCGGRGRARPAWRRRRHRRNRSPIVSRACSAANRTSEPAPTCAGGVRTAGHRRSDLSAGHDPRRRVHLCRCGAGQAADRQRSALSGDDHQNRARMHRQWRRDHRADRHSGPRHCRPGRRAVVGPGPAARRGGAGRRVRKDHRHQGLPDHGQHDRRRQRAVHAGGRRSDLSGACRRGRRHLHLLYRLRPAGPEARAEARCRRRKKQRPVRRRAIGLKQKAGAIDLAPAFVHVDRKSLSSAWRELRRCPWPAGRRRPSP